MEGRGNAGGREQRVVVVVMGWVVVVDEVRAKGGRVGWPGGIWNCGGRAARDFVVSVSHSAGGPLAAGMD
eukprot:748748-Lingulodinium_polyedra.AAC.1